MFCWSGFWNFRFREVPWLGNNKMSLKIFKTRKNFRNLKHFFCVCENHWDIMKVEKRFEISPKLCLGWVAFWNLYSHVPCWRKRIKIKVYYSDYKEININSIQSMAFSYKSHEVMFTKCCSSIYATINKVTNRVMSPRRDSACTTWVCRHDLCLLHKIYNLWKLMKTFISFWQQQIVLINAKKKNHAFSRVGLDWKATL